jgi:long-subunit acyl-CoA synthetase (AMP-forming)
MIIYYSPIKEDIIGKFKIPVISMGNFMLNKNNLIFTPKLNDVATIIYTSGTTGMPKGAVITHKNIMNSVKKCLEMYSPIKSKTRFYKENIISYLPLNHIAGQILDIYIPISSVSTVWFADKDALKGSLPITLKEVRPTIFAGVPRVWEKIGDELNKGTNKMGFIGKIIKSIYPKRILKEAGLEKCKLYITLGAPISHIARDKLKNFKITLYDIYGMSETTGAISISTPDNYKNSSVGKPIMEIKISRDKEILVRGNNLFKEYNGDKEATQNAFSNGWFKTGDIGYIDTDGFLYITGRKKEIIITVGGENISPLPIEERIKEYFGNMIEHVVVIGEKKKYLIAILNIKPNKKEQIELMLKDALYFINKKAQSTTHQIKEFLIIETPFEIGKELTPTYKLRRNFINENYKENIEKIYEK